MGKFYIHAETGAYSDEPWDRDEAKAMRRPQFRDVEPCPDCATKHPYRYVYSGACAFCAAREHEAHYRAVRTGAPPPEPKLWQHYDSFNGRTPCLFGPHLRHEDPATGRCVGCDHERDRPRMTPEQQIATGAPWVQDRETARTERLPLYAGAPCAEEHTGLRFVHNGGCYECISGRSVAETVELPAPLKSRTRHPNRALAREAGERTYRCDTPCKRGHAPIRWVSSALCVECVKEQRAEYSDPGDRGGKPRSADVEMALAAPDMLLSKEDARLLGLKVYRTGGACQNGHRGWRYTSTGNCLDCRLGR